MEWLQMIMENVGALFDGIVKIGERILALLILPFFLLYISIHYSTQTRERRDRMRSEISAYIRENQATLERSDGKLVRYDTFGEMTGSVDYGYIFSEEERDYGEITDSKSDGYYRYADGVRKDRRSEWVYEEKLFDHWYYYEVHID